MTAPDPLPRKFCGGKTLHGPHPWSKFSDSPTESHEKVWCRGVTGKIQYMADDDRLLTDLVLFELEGSS